MERAIGRGQTVIVHVAPQPADLRTQFEHGHVEAGGLHVFGSAKPAGASADHGDTLAAQFAACHPRFIGRDDHPEVQVRFPPTVWLLGSIIVNLACRDTDGAW